MDFDKIMSSSNARKSGDEVIMDCPKCFGAHKLYANFKKGVWHCFRCNLSGRIATNFPQYKERPVIEPTTHTITQIPTDSIPVVGNSRAMKYLRGRNLVPPANWRFCFAGPYKDRIIIPIEWEGKYVGFQARTLHTKENCWCVEGKHLKLLKYITSPGLKISQMIYNYSNVPAPKCYIVEGVFNTLRLKGSVAAFSKQLTKRHAELIALKYEHVILALDLDAMKDTLRAGYQLFAFGINVSVLPLIHNDPAEHTEEELKSLLPVPFLEWAQKIPMNSL